MSDHMRDNDMMEGQVVELTEAEQAQHQLQMEQQLKSFWAKQLVEVRPSHRVISLSYSQQATQSLAYTNAHVCVSVAQMEQLEVGSEQGASFC